MKQLKYETQHISNYISTRETVTYYRANNTQAYVIARSMGERSVAFVGYIVSH